MRRHPLYFRLGYVLFCSTLITACGDNSDDGTTPAAETVTKTVTNTVTETITNTVTETVTNTVTETVTNTVTETVTVEVPETVRTSPVPFGTIVDRLMAPVLDADGQVVRSDYFDFTSLLPVGDKLFSITQVEDRPGAAYLTELKQNATTGVLTPLWTRPLDFSGAHGVYNPCAGSVTPWGTHLGSEEYPLDARAFEGAKLFANDTLRYFGMDIYTDAVTWDFTGATPTSTPTPDSKPDLLQSDVARSYHPYFHGYNWEVTVTENGEATISKHYSMGRVAVELGRVMPDRKTVYITDDGAYVGLFLYIAATAGDLSAGTLYAARWTQTGTTGGGSATLSWIQLGPKNVTDAEVSRFIDQGVKFADLFTTGAAPVNGACETGFTFVKAEGRAECLKLNSGMEAAASRLETRRYAAYVGATVEFNKEEGVAIDVAGKKLYVAMSDVTGAMLTAANEPDHIHLPENRCGTVFQLDLTTDATLGSDWVATNMTGLVSGSSNASVPSNSCDINGIANPDNLTFIDGYDTLIIGEDTSRHQNDAMWSYNRTSKELVRIETTPYGSETTSPYFYPDINGFAYIVSVVQHPYGESDESKLLAEGDARGYVGYLGPFPAMTGTRGSLAFQPVSFPDTDTAKRLVTSSAGVLLDHDTTDTTPASAFPIAFHTILRGGDQPNRPE